MYYMSLIPLGISLCVVLVVLCFQVIEDKDQLTFLYKLTPHCCGVNCWIITRVLVSVRRGWQARG